MATLKLYIKGQTLTIESDIDRIVEKSQNYLKFEIITSDSDWNDTTKKVVFKSEDLEMNGASYVPQNVIRAPGFLVTVVGTNTSNGKRITTFPVPVRVWPCENYTGTGTDTPTEEEITQTWFDEVLKYAQDAYNLVQEVKDNVDQHYDENSPNPQSGKAVAAAIAEVTKDFDEKFEKGKNLLDESNLEPGAITDTGTNNNNATTFKRTYYIHLEPGSYIYSNSSNSYASFRVCIYDLNKNFERTQAGADNNAFTIDSPKYIRIHDAKSRTNLQLEMGTTPTEHEPYTEKIKLEYLSIDQEMSSESEKPVQNKVIKKYVDDEILKVDSKNNSIDIFELGKNLLDESNLEPGAITSTGQPTTNENFKRTDYIYLEAGSYVYSNDGNAYGSFKIYFYNLDKSFASPQPTVVNRTFTIDSPKYVRIHNTASSFTNYEHQLEKGTVPTTPEPYTKKVKVEYIPVNLEYDAESKTPQSGKAVAQAIQEAMDEIEEILENVESDVDNVMSSTSENPVQNKVVKVYVDTKADLKLANTNQQIKFKVQEDKLIASIFTGDETEVDELDLIAYEDKTYRDIFITNNLIPFGNFENGWGSPTVVTGAPEITTEDYNAGSKSLKCFGTTQQTLRYSLPVTEITTLYACANVKVNRYETGGFGIQLINVQNQKVTVAGVTDGFTRVSATRELKTNSQGSVSCAIDVGSRSSSNLDGYIDDVVVVDLSMFTTQPTQSELDVLYDNYIKIITGQGLETGGNETQNQFVIGGNDLPSNVQLNWFDGKTILFNGDSITYGTNLEPITQAYPYLVCKELNANIINHAIGGSTLAEGGADDTRRKPLIARYDTEVTDEVAETVDLVYIAIGTNDWAYNYTEVGTMEDRVTTTFYGALHLLCQGLLNKYKGKPIIFATPIKRRLLETDTSPTDRKKNGKTLKEYGDIIKEVCDFYSIPVLDMYSECCLTPFIDEQRNLYFQETSGGTHPNAEGAKIMARRVVAGLRSIVGF